MGIHFNSDLLVLSAAIAFIVFVIIFIVKKIKHMKFSAPAIILKFIFTVYILAVVSVTLFPITICVSHIHGINYIDVNVIPFKSIAEQFGNLSETHFSFGFRLKELFLNIGGNILLLMPLGFLAPFLKSCFKNLKCCLLLGLLVSVAIELLQLVEQLTRLAYRATDIDDVILNVFGVFWGFLLYQLFGRVLAKLQGLTKNRS